MDLGSWILTVGMERGSTNVKGDGMGVSWVRAGLVLFDWCGLVGSRVQQGVLGFGMAWSRDLDLGMVQLWCLGYGFFCRDVAGWALQGGSTLKLGFGEGRSRFKGLDWGCDLGLGLDLGFLEGFQGWDFMVLDDTNMGERRKDYLLMPIFESGLDRSSTLIPIDAEGHTRSWVGRRRWRNKVG